MPASAGLERFFHPGRIYAVAGANPDPSRFGFKIFNWYVQRSLPVTPINPKAVPILGVEPVPTLTALIAAASSSGSSTVAAPLSEEGGIGLSVVTPPAVSVKLMQEAAALLGQNGKEQQPVKAVWFQPGTYNNEVLQAAAAAKIENIIAYEDCILVQGDMYLQAQPRI